MGELQITIPLRSFKGFIIALLFAIFLVGGIILSYVQGAMASSKDESFVMYNKYQEIIQHAEQYQGEYLKEGVVKQFVYSDSFHKWSIHYEIHGKSFSTFSTYSDIEKERYSIGSKILIALNSQIINNDTICVYTDFKNVDFKESAELYFAANLCNTLNILKIACFAMSFVVGGCALGFIIVKKLKSEDLSAKY